MLPKNKSLNKPKGDKGISKVKDPKGNKNKGSNKNKHGSKPKMPKFMGGRGGYKGVSTRKVNKLTGGLIRDEVRDMRKERTSLKREARSERRRADTQYERGLGDLDHVFKETGGYLNHLQGLTQQNTAQEGSRIQQANAALQSQLGDTYTGAADAAQAELARLGIQGGGNLGQLYADQANAQGVAAQSGQNSLDTLGMQGANANMLAGLLQGMNQGSYTSAVGKNLNTRNDLLTEIAQNRRDGMGEVRDAIRDVRAGRKDLFTQLMAQLQETGWSQYMDQQQMKLARDQFNFSKKQANKK